MVFAKYLKLKVTMLGGGKELCQNLVNFPTFSETSPLKGNRDIISL